MTQPRKHRHAALIKQWLDDDSLEVEYRCPGDYDWRDVSNGTPTWHHDMEYRFKPKMIKCGDMEFPEPMRVAPEEGSRFYFPNPLGRCVWIDLLWVGDEIGVMLLKRGFCHTTQAAAEQHARALIALTEMK